MVLVAILVGALRAGQDPVPPGRILKVGQVPAGETGDVLPGTHPISHRQPSQKEWTELEALLEGQAKKSPGDLKVQTSLALVYYNLGRFDEAAGVYRVLLARGEDALLRNRLGNVLRDKGNLSGAEAAYRKALTDNATFAPAYLNLAELLWRQGQDKAALGVVEQGRTKVSAVDRPALDRAKPALSPAATGQAPAATGQKP